MPRMVDASALDARACGSRGSAAMAVLRAVARLEDRRRGLRRRCYRPTRRSPSMVTPGVDSSCGSSAVERTTECLDRLIGVTRTCKVHGSGGPGSRARSCAAALRDARPLLRALGQSRPLALVLQERDPLRVDVARGRRTSSIIVRQASLACGDVLCLAWSGLRPLGRRGRAPRLAIQPSSFARSSRTNERSTHSQRVS